MLPTKIKTRKNRKASQNPTSSEIHNDFSPLYDDGIHRALIQLSYQAEYVSFKANTSAFLPSIQTKIGGMPYTDWSDEWPRCQHGFCQQKMRFKFQTTTDLNRHNLLCFYVCDRCFDNQLNPKSWVIRAYQVDSMQRYAGNCLGHIDLESYSASIQKCFSLPKWDSLPLHDLDLQSSFRMMAPHSPEALYRYFLHEHHAQRDINSADLVIGGYPSCEEHLHQDLFTNQSNRFIAQLNNCAGLFSDDFCSNHQSLVIFCRDSKIEIKISDKSLLH